MQSITTQLAKNILVENNEIVGAFKPWPVYDDKGTLTEKEWEYKIFGADENRPHPDYSAGGQFRYYSRVDESRFIAQRNNRVYDNPFELDLVGYPMTVIDESAPPLRIPTLSPSFTTRFSPSTISITRSWKRLT